MLNKIYSSLKSFIKENYKLLLIYLIAFFILTYRLPYFIYIGGGIIDLSDRINLESNEKGSYNMAYVKEMQATIPTYLLSFFNSKWEVVKLQEITIDKQEDSSDIDKREKLYLEEANHNAILSAYKLAKKEVFVKESTYKVIYVNENSQTNIKIGDQLLSVNGIDVDDDLNYKESLKNLNIGDKINIKVLRNNQELDCYANIIELNHEKVIGLYLINIIDFETNPSIEIKSKWNESGPSGGFMTSLAIYDRLVEEDLTKGRKIVGTGTIDKDGKVGEISGVKYKLMGAVKKKADIFFVPKENYEEALETKKKYNYKTEIVQVETLEEAVNYLKK